jgi:hypothetical protein
MAGHRPPPLGHSRPHWHSADLQSSNVFGTNILYVCIVIFLAF